MTMKVHCRPKPKVFRLLILTDALLFVAMGAVLLRLAQQPAWEYAGLLTVLLLLFILLLVRIVTGQRELYANKQEIRETYRFFERERRFPLSALQSWEEIRIRTTKSQRYKQLRLYFPEHQTVKLSSEEFEGYDALYALLTNRAAAKKK